MDILHHFWALHVLHCYELHNISHLRNNPMDIRRQFYELRNLRLNEGYSSSHLQNSPTDIRCHFSQLLAVVKLTQVQRMRIHKQ